jgi:hypothetical protein
MGGFGNGVIADLIMYVHISISMYILMYREKCIDLEKIFRFTFKI